MIYFINIIPSGKQLTIIVNAVVYGLCFFGTTTKICSVEVVVQEVFQK